MAATVAQARERVVLGEDPDARAGGAATGRRRGLAAASNRPDRRLQAARRMGHLESVAGQDLGDPGGRPDLLECRLRAGMDAVREVEDLVTCGLDGGGEPGLRLGERLGGTDGGQ